MFHSEGRQQASHAALERALEIAEAAGATALLPRLLSWLAWDSFFLGQVDGGFALLHRARALAGESGNSAASLEVAVTESDALLRMGKCANAAEVALHGLRAAGQAGLKAWVFDRIPGRQRSRGTAGLRAHG